MRRCEWKRLPAVGLVATFLIIGAHAHAQSFDCGRASTAVEQAICSDKVLRDLDSSLASELRDSMADVSGEQLRDFLREERRWIAHRNKYCAPASLTASESLPECLATVYRARIAYLKSLRTPDTSNCQRIADRYRPLATTHPGEPPLSVVAASPTSGITLAPPVAEITDRADLQRWASNQTPSFVVPADLIRFSTRGTLTKVPGANFYGLDSEYFSVQHGRLHPELPPPGFDRWSGASGGVFGRIDDASVSFKENYNETPQMSSDITVATWSEGGFYSVCKVTFSFAPRFSDQTLSPWENMESWKACKGSECADLRRAAFELVEAVQRNPTQARNQWKAKLSPKQTTEYEADLGVAVRQRPERATDHSEVDPANITREHPIRIPYIRQGRVYLTSLGHFTINGRYFPDWDVIFEALEDGKLVSEGEFAVGMRKGDLKSVSFSGDR